MKKNKRSDKSGHQIWIVAINYTGLTSKKESFDKIICDRKPSIWLLQETKKKLTDYKIKAKNLVEYQVFELRRENTLEEGGKGLNGGGLAVGALHDLNPVLLGKGDNEVEFMTIEVTTGLTRLR